MPTAVCCRSSSLPSASLFLPDNSRVSLLKRPLVRLSLHWTSPRLRFQSRFPINKWRVSCYRHENFSSEDPSSELTEDAFSEDLVKSNCDQSKDVNRDWLSNIHKGANAILGMEPWIVPWTGKTIIQVMLLWIASFWLVGSWIVPFLSYTAGFRKESLTHRGQALYSLLTDFAEGLVGIAILQRCLAKFQPLPSDWFQLGLKGKWLFDVGIGCFMFPLINQLSQVNLNLLPILPSTPVTISSVEQSIVARDPVSMALYAVVVSVCAPIWEEIVFRGFLLPSLTKYMPVWCAILVSSVAFALAHFNLQRTLPLVFLGMVMGVVFVRSRNLLPSMLLHSLWNAFVFLDLMK
ncbi:uncharacterized protein LOC114730315 [Neltuma alba]|uniref:uncharacterized protein LOC114730315 n=1 Tax=Neltuma alba TaxID=207710 RepID=UPI0010A30F42|nr:uncharacterized protein LOC114730315 [Prosopis alba]XP_028773196.1 uncharacterized protein LOC114730315 [Prosopis alba]XP_028773197.1 uncharacterized protein LOC114730315 [Prosopis alba]XP_028773198.1 uncharacterized protein LOC114730315 [Prosopis alba]